jgi:hypothetical protein
MFGGRNEMITYEFANRKPGWLRDELADRLSRAELDLYAISDKYNDLAVRSEAILAYELVNVVCGFPFNRITSRADIASTWARIEREFKENRK